MGFWSIMGWAMAIVMILAFWAFTIYMCAIGISIYFPKVTDHVNHWVKHTCKFCGMARELGHWPGCDLWTGENLDLLIFRDHDGGEKE